jgi:hypothetical protein
LQVVIAHPRFYLQVPVPWDYHSRHLVVTGRPTLILVILETQLMLKTEHSMVKEDSKLGLSYFYILSVLANGIRFGNTSLQPLTRGPLSESASSHNIMKYLIQSCRPCSKDFPAHSDLPVMVQEGLHFDFEPCYNPNLGRGHWVTTLYSFQREYSSTERNSHGITMGFGKRKTYSAYDQIVFGHWSFCSG